MIKYVLAALVLLSCSIAWADKKVEVTKPANNVWAISVVKDDVNGVINDSVDVVRITDTEQNVVCYLILTTSYQPEIYCLRGH